MIAGIVDPLFLGGGGQVMFSFGSVGFEVQWDFHTDV